MIALVSVKAKGLRRLPNVGMNNRILLRGERSYLKKRATHYAAGYPFRIEWFNDSSFYSEPLKIEYFGSFGEPISEFE